MKNINLFLSLEPLITNGMSIFQMDKFVINDHITPYRKLRQAIVETKARLENITSYKFDIEELEIKIEKVNHELSTIILDEQNFNYRLKKVELKRLEFELNRKQAVLLQIEKEAEFFLNVVHEIIEKDFSGIDSVITSFKDPHFHLTHEAQFWTEKLSRSVCSDFVNYGTISKGVLESLSNLGLDQQKTILDKAVEKQHDFSIMVNNSKDILLVNKD